MSSMESFYHSGSKGGISGWSTFKSLRSLVAIANVKRAQLANLVNQLRPQVAIVDSEYALSPLRKRGIPIIGLNTSEMILTEYLNHPPKNPSIRSHFWFVEFVDYLFHRRYCDLVLSPFLLRTPTRHRKFQRIGLIARRAVLERAREIPSRTLQSPKQIRTVVFMLSGSVHASTILLKSTPRPSKLKQ